ncbi:MAG: hypothetical protein JW969_16670 [Spirochaetales bacterium]|nr:hypothetical protein [Spirochaetales bacterium]
MNSQSIPVIYKENYKVRSYECDFQARIFPHILYSYLLNAAWGHVRDTEFSYQGLEKKGQFWVVSRFLMEFLKIPEWDDTITIETWGKGIEKLFALRDYVVYSENGAEICKATSAWLMLDRNTLRPLKPALFLDNFPVISGRDVFPRIPSKIEPVSGNTVSYTSKVAFSDIDVNRHLNASIYMKWIIDSYPRKFHENHKLKSIEFNYMAEGGLGDEIRILVEESGKETLRFTNSLVRTGDNQELCRAITEWE